MLSMAFGLRKVNVNEKVFEMMARLYCKTVMNFFGGFNEIVVDLCLCIFIIYMIMCYQCQLSY